MACRRGVIVRSVNVSGQSCAALRANVPSARKISGIGAFQGVDPVLPQEKRTAHQAAPRFTPTRVTETTAFVEKRSGGHILERDDKRFVLLRVDSEFLVHPSVRCVASANRRETHVVHAAGEEDGVEIVLRATAGDEFPPWPADNELRHGLLGPAAQCPFVPILPDRDDKAFGVYGVLVQHSSDRVVSANYCYVPEQNSGII